MNDTYVELSAIERKFITMNKITEDCYISSSNPVQTISIIEVNYVLKNDIKKKKTRCYQIQITFEKQDIRKKDFEQVLLSQIVTSPELLYDQLKIIAEKLNLVKISPTLYIDRSLQIHSMTITHYLGKYPKMTGRYLLLTEFENGHKESDFFDDYESANAYMKTIIPPYKL